MKNQLAVTGFVLVLTGLVGLRPVRAQVAVSAEAEFRTRYLFAGVPFSTGPVGQAKVTVSYSGFTLSGFTNYDFDITEINEGDVWADYYHQFTDMIGGYLGGALYNFKIADDWEPTQEIYVGIVTAFPLNPSLHFARDFKLTKGHYFRFMLSDSRSIGTTTVSATGGINYNVDYYRVGSNFSHADLELTAALPVGRFTFTPKGVFQLGIADDFDEFVVGALNVSVGF